MVVRPALYDVTHMSTYIFGYFDAEENVHSPHITHAHTRSQHACTNSSSICVIRSVCTQSLGSFARRCQNLRVRVYKYRRYNIAGRTHAFVSVPRACERCPVRAHVCARIICEHSSTTSFVPAALAIIMRAACMHLCERRCSLGAAHSRIWAEQ